MAACACDQQRAKKSKHNAKLLFWESIIKGHELKLTEMRVKKYELCTRIKELQLKYPLSLRCEEKDIINRICNNKPLIPLGKCSNPLQQGQQIISESYEHKKNVTTSSVFKYGVSTSTSGLDGGKHRAVGTAASCICNTYTNTEVAQYVPDQANENTTKTPEKSLPAGQRFITCEESGGLCTCIVTTTGEDHKIRNINAQTRPNKLTNQGSTCVCSNESNDEDLNTAAGDSICPPNDAVLSNCMCSSQVSADIVKLQAELNESKQTTHRSCTSTSYIGISVEGANPNDTMFADGSTSRAHTSMGDVTPQVDHITSKKATTNAVDSNCTCSAEGHVTSQVESTTSKSGKGDATPSSCTCGIRTPRKDVQPQVECIVPKCACSIQTQNKEVKPLMETLVANHETADSTIPCACSIEGPSEVAGPLMKSLVSNHETADSTIPCACSIEGPSEVAGPLIESLVANYETADSTIPCACSIEGPSEVAGPLMESLVANYETTDSTIPCTCSIAGPSEVAERLMQTIVAKPATADSTIPCICSIERPSEVAGPLMKSLAANHETADSIIPCACSIEGPSEVAGPLMKNLVANHETADSTIPCACSIEGPSEVAGPLMKSLVSNHETADSTIPCACSIEGPSEVAGPLMKSLVANHETADSTIPCACSIEGPSEVAGPLMKSLVTNHETADSTIPRACSIEGSSEVAGPLMKSLVANHETADSTIPRACSIEGPSEVAGPLMKSLVANHETADSTIPCACSIEGPSKVTKLKFESAVSKHCTKDANESKCLCSVPTHMGDVKQQVDYSSNVTEHVTLQTETTTSKSGKGDATPSSSSCSMRTPTKYLKPQVECIASTCTCGIQTDKEDVKPQMASMVTNQASADYFQSCMCGINGSTKIAKPKGGSVVLKYDTMDADGHIATSNVHTPIGDAKPQVGSIKEYVEPKVKCDVFTCPCSIQTRKEEVKPQVEPIAKQETPGDNSCECTGNIRTRKECNHTCKCSARKLVESEVSEIVDNPGTNPHIPCSPSSCACVTKLKTTESDKYICTCSICASKRNTKLPDEFIASPCTCNTNIKIDDVRSSPSILSCKCSICTDIARGVGSAIPTVKPIDHIEVVGVAKPNDEYQKSYLLTCKCGTQNTTGQYSIPRTMNMPDNENLRPKVANVTKPESNRFQQSRIPKSIPFFNCKCGAQNGSVHHTSIIVNLPDVKDKGSIEQRHSSGCKCSAPIVALHDKASPTANVIDHVTEEVIKPEYKFVCKCTARRKTAEDQAMPIDQIKTVGVITRGDRRVEQKPSFACKCSARKKTAEDQAIPIDQVKTVGVITSGDRQIEQKPSITCKCTVRRTTAADQGISLDQVKILGVVKPDDNQLAQNLHICHALSGKSGIEQNYTLLTVNNIEVKDKRLKDEKLEFLPPLPRGIPNNLTASNNPSYVFATPIIDERGDIVGVANTKRNQAIFIDSSKRKLGQRQIDTALYKEQRKSETPKKVCICAGESDLVREIRLRSCNCSTCTNLIAMNETPALNQTLLSLKGKETTEVANNCKCSTYVGTEPNKCNRTAEIENKVETLKTIPCTISTCEQRMIDVEQCAVIDHQTVENDKRFIDTAIGDGIIPCTCSAQTSPQVSTTASCSCSSLILNSKKLGEQLNPETCSIVPRDTGQDDRIEELCRDSTCSCKLSQRSSLKSFLARGMRTPPELNGSCSCESIKTAREGLSDCSCTTEGTSVTGNLTPVQRPNMPQYETRNSRTYSSTPKTDVYYTFSQNNDSLPSEYHTPEYESSLRSRYSNIPQKTLEKRKPSLMPMYAANNETLADIYRTFSNANNTERSGDQCGLSCLQTPEVSKCSLTFSDLCRTIISSEKCRCSTCLIPKLCSSSGKRNKFGKDECCCFPKIPNVRDGDSLLNSEMNSRPLSNQLLSIPNPTVDTKCSPFKRIMPSKKCQTRKKTFQKYSLKHRHRKVKISVAQTNSNCSVCSCSLREATMRDLQDYGIVENGTSSNNELESYLSEQLILGLSSDAATLYPTNGGISKVTRKKLPDNSVLYTMPIRKSEITFLYHG